MAFDLIKEALINAPVMVWLDYSKNFELYMDVSSFRLGAILVQKHLNGEHVIAYAR